MYAFSPSLRAAWAELFSFLFQSLNRSASPSFDIRYSNTLDDFHDPNLCLGHICGYPFQRDFLDTHEVIAVPEFAIDGCTGLHYSSWVVARAGDLRHALEDFKDSIAAINSPDSNSGMNAFRHTLSGIAPGPRFFREVKLSGSHLNSLALIRSRNADIAAIDAITFDLAQRLHLFDPSNFKILTQTRSAPGLPFIAHRKHGLDAAVITSALNSGLSRRAEHSAATLPIQRFSMASSDLYCQIKELEEAALRRGYPKLR